MAVFSEKSEEFPIDELELVSRMREDQGNHECEVWLEGNVGAGQWEACTKNPGHTNFVPAQEFTIDHLPPSHRDDDVFGCLNLISKLTVRLRVTYTSPARPDGYVFSKFRGKRISHVGSGMVTELLSSEMQLVDDDEQGDNHEAGQITDADTNTLEEEFVNDEVDSNHCQDDEEITYDYCDEEEIISLMNPAGGFNGPCPCRECKISSSPCTVYWKMSIFTATHVVFDSVEAENTIVDVFLDSEQSSSMKEMYGTALVRESITEDGCYMECVTHDKKLYEHLHQQYVQLARKESQMFQKRTDNPYTPLCVVISYPHGYHKHVSVGAWTERKISEVRHDCVVTEYQYNAPTCPGSSGAPVFLLGGGIRKGIPLAYTIHYHSSGLDNGTNESGSWIEIEHNVSQPFSM